jgi:hypothetical protein
MRHSYKARFWPRGADQLPGSDISIEQFLGAKDGA